VPADTPAADPAGAGLRERKKARTRAEIRRQGLRLFREQGYHETTTEQIAAAAEVSPATFFRYFPTKERVVLSYDLKATMLAAMDEQPADLPVLTALHPSREPWPGGWAALPMTSRSASSPGR
jgi:AcrR family transcriptional regulator